MRKRLLALGVLLATVVSTTGCGIQLTKLSDDDESRFVAYCTQVVSKHNMNNDTGLVNIPKQTASEEEKSEESSSEEKTEETSASSSSSADNTSESSTEQKSQETQTFSEAIGIGGMRFLYRDARTASGYQQGEAYDLTADQGNELLVVRLKAENTTDKSIDIDMPSQNITFTATYGDQSVNSDMTLLMNDLTTYQGTFKAGKRRNMLLLFQFPKGTVKDTDKIQFSVKKGDETVSIDTQRSEKD
ncbi:MAG: hypothetical protein PUG68_04415 [Lachnospiraceae bacterium]|jgi:hypothetical protein|nr:hypothetical protein [Lachnospiraceae bacterium]MDD7327034.1 hypothetical protein [Lachnospiraceae bacterium]MDY2759425.1 hypothetical protein [Lachnospiraceae bacterium]